MDAITMRSGPGISAPACMVEEDGAPGGIRTPDQWLRKPLLYPAELQARCAVTCPLRGMRCQRVRCWLRSPGRAGRAICGDDAVGRRRGAQGAAAGYFATDWAAAGDVCDAGRWVCVVV